MTNTPTPEQIAEMTAWMDDLPCCLDSPNTTGAMCKTCDRHAADMVRALAADRDSQKARADAAEALVRWAHDTLYEINPNNYDHDEVCKLNDASVEVILGLAPSLGETHGYPKEWWDARASLAADRDEQKAWVDAAELELHGPISDLTGADITNIIAHLSLELEPRGPLPTRNSVMMALIAAQNDLSAEKAKVARLVEVLKWTDIELVKLFGLWFDDRPRSQIRAAIAEVQE